MIQSVHTTNLLRKDFSWIPGKQILNLELLVGGLWCIFLNQLNQSHSASYSFPVCGSLFFLNHQLFREAERGKWDGSKKPFFCPLVAQLCLMLQLPLPWHMEQLRAGMDILRWGWAQPDLALGIYQQLSICHLLAQNTFFPLKLRTGVQCWVIMRFLSMPVLPGLCDTLDMGPTEEKALLTGVSLVSGIEKALWPPEK